MNRKHLSALVRDRDHILKILRGQSDRLLADDVLARLEALNDDRLVVVVRDSDSDEVDRLVVEGLLQRPVCVDTAGLREVAALLLDIPDTVQVNDVALKRVLTMPAAHSAVTDNN